MKLFAPGAVVALLISAIGCSGRPSTVSAADPTPRDSVILSTVLAQQRD